MYLHRISVLTKLLCKIGLGGLTWDCGLISLAMLFLIALCQGLFFTINYPSETFHTVYSNEDYLLELLTEADLVTAEQIDSVRGQLKGRESVVERLIAESLINEEQVAQVCALTGVVVK